MSFASRARLLALAVITIGSAFVLAGAAGNVRASQTAAAVWAYRDAHPGAAVPVIVQAAPGRDPAALVTAAGGQVRANLGLIHAVSATIPGGRLGALAATPGVTWVSLDGAVSSTSGPGPSPVTATLPSVYPQEIRADKLWGAGDSGQGIGVAVVDTGITSSDDFGDRVIASVSRDGSKGDAFGHGSHVAGLIGGSGANSNGTYTGVAPKVNLIDVNIGGSTGTATVGDVINGLQWVLDHKDTYNIRVVNLSLLSNTAQSYTTDPLDAAVELLTFRGILVVAAAGNSGVNTVNYAPANDPFVLTVGALDDKGTTDYRDDNVPPWSSRGTTQDGFAKPDVYAPGRGLVSVLSPNSYLAQLLPANIVGSKYFQLSGTSMAAGVMSGAAALLFNQHPGWTPGQAKAALMRTSVPLPADATADVPQLDSATTFNPVDASLTIPPNQLLLTAAGVITPQSISWGSVSWGSISWGSITWSSISWGSISWGSVSWGSVPND
ncbi:MAG: S8 family serine peptidase [Dehalococcoidia bacterium]